MKTFDEALDEMARKDGFDNWKHLIGKYDDASGLIPSAIIESAAKLFAKNMVIEALSLSGDRFNSGLSNEQILKELGL